MSATITITIPDRHNVDVGIDDADVGVFDDVDVELDISPIKKPFYGQMTIIIQTAVNIHF